MTTLAWRSASKADRRILEQFTCTQVNGPDYERLVQRYFRVQAIAHAGGRDAARTDHRLLLLFSDGELAATACHRRSAPSPDTRHVVFAAVRIDLQGKALADGTRVSAALWSAVLQDIRTRPGEPATSIYAEARPSQHKVARLLQPNEAEARPA